MIDIDDYLAQITALQDHAGVFRTLHGYLDGLGFDYHSYDLLRAPEGLETSFYSTTYPQAFIERYIDQRYTNDDRICRHVSGTVQPFLWTQAFAVRPSTRRERQVQSEGAEAGIISGACLPLHGPDSAKAYIAVGSGLPADEFERLFLPLRHMLQLVASYTHERLIELGLPRSRDARLTLKRREVEVLTWTARGKTAWDISVILSLSEATVNEYIASACRKLGVHNKTHAAALALSLRLIAL